MSCETKLKNLIADNFFGYFKAHVYHANVIDKDFNQYHNFFGEIYEYLYDNHDDLLEQLRQMDVMVPVSIKDYINNSVIDIDNKENNLSGMLNSLLKTLESLIKVAQVLYEEAGREGHGGLETFIGDYLVGVNKLRWKVKSCLN